MIKILLTGATGFVGSHLAEEAQQRGYEVFALVRKQSNVAALQALNITCLEAELTNKKALEKVFQDLQEQGIVLDSVIHCAALTKAKNWETYRRVNVEATNQLVKLLQQYQPALERFIFVSSLAANGPAALGQTIRIADVQPITDYGRSKLAAEERIKESGIPYLIFRPTAVYGPREKDIYTLFQLIFKGIYPLIGSHRQDLTFIYVKDLVDLLLRSLRMPADNQTFFATDGKVYAKAALGDYIQEHLPKRPLRLTIPLGLVRALAFIVQSLFALQNKLAPLNLEKYQELKAESWNCEIAYTFDTFAFRPQYDLKRGVAETISWYRHAGWLK